MAQLPLSLWEIILKGRVNVWVNIKNFTPYFKISFKRYLFNVKKSALNCHLYFFHYGFYERSVSSTLKSQLQEDRLCLFGWPLYAQVNTGPDVHTWAVLWGCGAWESRKWQCSWGTLIIIISSSTLRLYYYCYDFTFVLGSEVLIRYDAAFQPLVLLYHHFPSPQYYDYWRAVCTWLMMFIGI